VLKIFVVCGEPSGDLLAASILLELSKRAPLELYGTGGVHLAAMGQIQAADVKELSVIGFVGIVKKILFLFSLADKLRKRIMEIKPDLILLVDYTGFNLRFAKRLKDLNIPVVQIVAPQVWAWGYSRVKILKEYFDKVLCVLPFEEALLRGEGVNAVYVGHPVVEKLKWLKKDRIDFLETFFGKDMDDRPIICLAPGSRAKEVNSLVPIMGEALKYFKDSFRFILACADCLSGEDVRKLLPADMDVKVIAGHTQSIFLNVDLIWICSGTATLEASILGTPMIIMYKISRIDFMLGKILSKLRVIGLPNIILGKTVVPEMVGPACTANNLINFTKEMLNNLPHYRKELAPISAMFADREPAKEAAREILLCLNP
jgi:lipid-A-disaccharide synthase